MRVTVTTSGDVVVDADTPAQAAAFVRELRGAQKPARKKKAPLLELESVEEPLSQPLVDTWNWLVANATGHNEGISAGEAAAGMNIPANTATYRLKQLVAKGLAHQPVQARYRPGEA